MSRGRGHVKQRGNKWVVVVDSGSDPATGKRRRKWHSGYATKREAEKARTAILAALDHQTYVEPDRLTLGGYLTDRWLPAIEGTVRPNTAALYRTVLSTYVLPHIGAVPLQSLTGADVQGLYGTLSTRGGRTGGALSPNTVQSAHRALRKALGDAVAWGLLVRNPATGVKPPQQRRPKPKTWTADELSQFLRRVDPELLVIYGLGSLEGILKDLENHAHGPTAMWRLAEFTSLLRKANNKATATLTELLLNLYDRPPQISSRTQVRGFLTRRQLPV